MKVVFVLVTWIIGFGIVGGMLEHIFLIKEPVLFALYGAINGMGVVWIFNRM